MNPVNKDKEGTVYAGSRGWCHHTGAGFVNVINKLGKPWLVWLRGLSAACEPKGRRFDSQSGHKPGLLARCPVGAM